MGHKNNEGSAQDADYDVYADPDSFGAEAFREGDKLSGDSSVSGPFVKSSRAEKHQGEASRPKPVLMTPSNLFHGNRPA